ncbi:MAG: restriction endonuclease [Pseudanabaena sp. Salubria-1]|nr:restriction endonuclease [Pseudanabaena sp. Salubria-1]
MATIYAIRGLLLEEILLNLLSASGYLIVEYDSNDITLKTRSSGVLEVKGRGSNHQIDAIASFSISPPFSYPVRLLLEAKFYNEKVGIDIVRNAVGVLKDVSEFWAVVNNKIFKPRYHYQYAIFTSSSFTKQAQEYAFAQDIYLIKLENNQYFYPVIEALRNLSYTDFSGEDDKNIEIDLSGLRKNIRASLREDGNQGIFNYCRRYNFDREKLSDIINLNSELHNSYLGVLGNIFPIFLTASRDFDIEYLIDNPTIRICWNNNKWYIVKNNAECSHLNERDIIFSFDLPLDLFKLYADNKMLSKNRALDLKQEFMNSIQIVFKDRRNRIISSLELKLDNDWLREMREHI